ncbi:MAG: exodeoxyribonuclease VII small subunit [Betaproteobacteria bacterium]|jgi:exodeoxyribonuclease VII small subunit|nr:exodeoxyribonuclease VII small subunit [Betaproteobacteria bacterium]
MSQAAKDKLPESFEAALAELESIVQGMETGKLSLEESLTAYQRGAALLKHCQGALTAAEQKIQVLEAGQLKDLPRTES